MQVLGTHRLQQFGEFQLDADQKILRRGDEIVPLPLKAAELLCVLVENRGEVVPKQVLMEKVWADAFVEDSVLTQNIYLLRKTLKSNGTVGSIKNVPRRGYVFEAPVSPAHETVFEHRLTERVEIEEVEESETGSPSRLHIARSVIAVAVFSVLAALLLIGGAYFRFRADPPKAAFLGPSPIISKAPAVASAAKTLAILPFKSSDTGLSASFSNDLSIRLGSMNKFPVKPSALVSEYAKNGADVTADFVLEGDVRSAKNMYIADVHLVEEKNNGSVSLGKFEYDNMIQLQDAIANKVAEAVLGRLSVAERNTASTRLPSNASAYQSFQTGYLLWRRRADGSAFAKKAIELDSSFAPAYALLANIRATGGVRDSPAAHEAEDLLEKAFALDENLADAHAVQGFIRIFHYRDWKGAESSLRNALELDPNNINAHHWLGVLYSIRRNLDEAKKEMERALELDPTNATILADIGQLHYFAGEKDLSMEYINKALELDPGNAQAQSYLGMVRSQAVSGDKEAVLDQLANSATENAFTLPYINVDPRYDGLRDDRRFQKILHSMDLGE